VAIAPMKLGLVRRGHSGSGGAEAYLGRFAEAARAAGHETILFASEEWKSQAWPSGELRIIGGNSPRRFADALESARPREHCDFLFSLERVWSCDAYRAGDGVHRAWLDRRAGFEPGWKHWLRERRRKHRELLELERELFSPDGPRLVIANSKMVRDEIVAAFPYPPDRIQVIYNGVPGPSADRQDRMAAREELGLGPGEFAVLFAGSGWERKGLRFAVKAANAAGLSHLRLLVAGRGRRSRLPRSPFTIHLGQVRDLRTAFLAADLFVLPTLYDPFSNACLEALAAGLPVVTTAANGFAEILTPASGEILSDPSDVPALAAAFRKWSEPERLIAGREEAVRIASRFDIQSNVRATLSAITAAALDPA
jgi:UDP-glucose:(heptosyl)LPS alpha-1,3-glucosyltransferase